MAEDAVKGRLIKDLHQSEFPACVKERGMFMADFAFSRQHVHPYVKHGREAHAHFRPTLLRYPEYSAAALPFRWLMKSFVFGDQIIGPGLVDRFPLQDVDLSLEPSEEVLGFKTNWLQDHRNHRTLLDTFWAPVKIEESLVFFYAKQVPFVEDTGRRVIVGIGRVKSLGSLTEYEYDGPAGNRLRSLIWERMVGHSIRQGGADGFLMPYRLAVAKSEDGQRFDPAEVAAFAPEERFEEFSYATEHVGHDAAISALLSCRAALQRAGELFQYDYSQQEAWIDTELGRLWTKRGPFPGMGAVLTANGIRLGNFVASALQDVVGDDGNPWTAWDDVLLDPFTHLSPDLAHNIDSTIAKAWLHMKPERRQFLELLSRADLTPAQAEFLAIPEERSMAGLALADDDFIRNPYLIFEATRLTRYQVSIGVVDRAMFPVPLIRNKYPLPEVSRIGTEVDARRLRALSICELEREAKIGHTLLPRDRIVVGLREKAKAEGERGAEVTGDLLQVAEDTLFEGVVEVKQMADGTPAYQLERLAKAGDLIRRVISARVGGNRLEVTADWASELDSALPPLPSDQADLELELRARKEKAAALRELAESRFSVLIGSAGTGKTTLLSILCRQPEISRDKILLLAPTGKARVRMESIAKDAGTTNYQAFTLAQFLAKSDRYRGDIQQYRMIGKPGENYGRTVVVDECSMLTEEMMAATLEALDGVHRLIFVGDPRQLPPIGPGRPFVDIVAELEPESFEDPEARVARGYAELLVPRRQGVGDREDLQLAAWFGGSETGPGEDQVFEILTGQRKSKFIQFVAWETPDEFDAALPDALASALNFDRSKDEQVEFARSFGAYIDPNQSAWFGAAYKDRVGSGEQSEAWQILSPVRQKPWGVESINRLIQRRYMARTTAISRQFGWSKRIPSPMGDAQIVYGNKVINNRNTSIPQRRMYPEPTGRGYLANGEIGVVVGHRKTQKKPWKPDYMEVEFSTQPGTTFKYFESDFGEEGEASLDLAYALTVHKAQGSEFGTVFLVLPRSTLFLSRELLYTALTRQKNKIVVLHQGSATNLQQLSSEKYSASATRLTNLFRAPKPIKIGDVFLEERLIHVTARGDLVRSKSEVIIADHLFSLGLNYHYEAPLDFGGTPKYPDFTIHDDNSGISFYWEHCGMLGDPGYRRRWAEKQAWYRQNEILPHEEGGGKNGTLIVTNDSLLGGISSQDIQRLIKSVLLGDTS